MSIVLSNFSTATWIGRLLSSSLSFSDAGSFELDGKNATITRKEAVNTVKNMYPCITLMQAVLGMMERMLPSQMAGKITTIVSTTYMCDFWLVKEICWTERRMEHFITARESFFYKDTVAQCHIFVYTYTIINHIHTEQSSVAVC
jgi:hypothetical protein